MTTLPRRPRDRGCADEQQPAVCVVVIRYLTPRGRPKPAPIPKMLAGHGSAERAETQIEDGVNVCGREQLVSHLHDRHEDYRRRLAEALQRRTVACALGP